MDRGGPLQTFTAVRPGERLLAGLMCGYFFLVIASFWVLKPLKKALFIGYYDGSGLTLGSWQLGAAQAELIAKVMNMGVAFVAVVVFTMLARRFRRQQLTLIFTAFVVACELAYAGLLVEPGAWTVWSFYLFGDLFSTLMVATFFAFLSDSVTPDAAKRLYGLIGLGGVAGGVFGSTVLAAAIESLDRSEWMGLTALLGVVIAAVAVAAGRIVDRTESSALGAQATDASPTPPSAPAGNAAIEGARLVGRSPYLLSIVAIVGLYEIVSTILDFQFTSTVSHYLDGPAIGSYFARVYSVTNFVSLFVQVGLTGWVLHRLGVLAALLALPVAVAGGSAAFALLPALWIGSSLSVIDNGLNYSINQSAKEALYVPTTREEKYGAKAFIDMFVQRLAKAVAVGLSLGITLVFDDFGSIPWLSLFVLPLVAAWLFAARYAGRHFRQVEGSVR